MEQILQLARLLGHQIQESEAYKKMMETKAAADMDTQLQDAIGQFNLKRMDLNMAMGGENPDKEKIDLVNKEIKELYGNIMLNPNMQMYTEAQGVVSGMVEQINTIISAALNGTDPDQVDPSAAHSCGGDCGSCGGCH